MPPRALASPATETTLTALALLAIAAFLAFRQWAELRGRELDLDQADRNHFFWKDRRRFAGSLVMAAISALMLIAARIEPRQSRAHGRVWGWIWITVLILVVGLLALGFLDWRANTRYAVRHRRALLAEQRDYFASLKRKSSKAPPPASSNGHSQGPSPSKPSPH
jgi:hypothetical protein